MTSPLHLCAGNSGDSHITQAGLTVDQGKTLQNCGKNLIDQALRLLEEDRPVSVAAVFRQIARSIDARTEAST